MENIQYLAILGRQPELGLAELEAVLGRSVVSPFGRQAAIVTRSFELAELGMIVKLAQVWYDGPVVDAKELPIDVAMLPLAESKTPFAVSLYGLNATRRYAEVVGLALKKRLKVRGSVRLVQPTTGTAVSSAGLMHNNVLEKGFELLVAVSGQRMVVAQTMMVQDIEAYAARDHGRPARSAKVGMLPPKLAQFLVNMAPRGAVIVDPFCGTGVVLQEARLLGHEVKGSDIDGGMVDMTRLNMDWLGSHYDALPAYELTIQDARKVVLPPTCSVVSEGYLGQALAVPPTNSQLASLKREVGDLYRQALMNWADQLTSGAVVALCAPSWRIKGVWHHLEIIDELPKMGYSLMEFAHTTTPLLYARPDQVVGRRLLFMRKR